MSEGQDALVEKFPVVGIGASAGGLEAFEAFFRACPVDTGMAFVLVSHLDPDHQSLLTEILQRCTEMPVAEAIDQIRVESDHVYVIPPNREIAILDGALQLSLPNHVRGQRMPIDSFLRSLADDQAELAIGIILSGTATDGTLGLRAIQAAGGVCMVQDPSTAQYDGMPRSAITAGYATHILPVDKMPSMLIGLNRQSKLRQKVPLILPARDVSGLNHILQQIRKITGHDFSLYKKSTIVRRIERRMAQNNIDDMSVYAHFIKRDSGEVQALFRELLINVTSFFRDPDAFDVLKQDILPLLLADKPDDYVFRVWVAGCASGEEAYSIAIVLRESMEETHQNFKVQIYATDLDEEAINVARSGCYPAGIKQDVTEERLRRYFIRDQAAGYKIKKDIREMVVFAVQSVIKDPPFTKLDMLSCRNLMIYLETEQQDRLIPNFHYALKPGGVLFLSSSESITHQPELFTALNRKWKFYRASYNSVKLNLPLSEMKTIVSNINAVPAKAMASKAIASVAELSNRILLLSYAPASVTTDVRGNILYIHGDTRRYLHAPAGPVTTNLVEMVNEGLQLELRAALNAASQGTPILNREVTLTSQSGSATVIFSVRVLRQSDSDDSLLLVSFQDEVESTPKRPRGKSVSKSVDAERITHLQRELAYAKESWQSTMEEQQATNEELKSTNEELQSTNEELQSSNEELETSKEELQSLNEETITVNSELNSKIEQLNIVQSDLKNLFDNVNSGTLFLDYHLILRRFTREAVKAYRLIDTDIGRPLSDIK